MMAVLDDHEHQPLFSVVMPTYNRGSSVRRSIERVLGQECDSFELIVVNDGSSDSTRSVLDSIRDDRVRVAHRSNGGISAARNTGAALARGRFVVPLDDDDAPGDNWLSSFEEALDDPVPSVISCGCTFIDPTTHYEVETRLPDGLGPVFENYSGLFLAGTFAVERRLYHEIGGFAEGLQCSHQTEFSLRLIPACRERDLGVAQIDRSTIKISRRAAGDRPESSPLKLLAGSEYVIGHHRERLAIQPSTLASFHSVAGVAAYRVGERRRARSHLVKAFRISPDIRHALRLATSLVPLVARRTW